MPHPAPTVPSERIQALDTIRGFAVLGILLMNILAFGLPSRAYFDPSVDGALSGADFGVFFVVDLLVEGVMRAVFSMLFGAGIALAASRETRPKGVGIYYRRQFLLLGMALYKTGFFQGRRSLRCYGLVAVLGFACGLTVNGFELAMKIGSGYAPEWVSGASVFTNDLGRVSLALGFVCVAMVAWQCDWFAGLRQALATVGRMALTNYILQSVFGLVIFHNFGLGLWNELARHQLYSIVLAEWVVLSRFSNWWLGRYRFGPLEWLWRSLTYGRVQPMAVPG